MCNRGIIIQGGYNTFCEKEQEGVKTRNHKFSRRIRRGSMKSSITRPAEAQTGEEGRRKRSVLAAVLA
jgi:hypothetical protein